jgi:uncharacterized membrane protein YjjB (DUF3815 family)
VNFGYIFHQMFFGAIAAAGFGVLFNIAPRGLARCAISGALALAVRTICQDLGLSLVGASFIAALIAGIATHLRWVQTDISGDVLALAGCIPMVPGSVASKALLALFQITQGRVVNNSQTLSEAAYYTLLVMFTIGAIGTGLVIPMLLVRRHTSG